jgi:hypothetical protein
MSSALCGEDSRWQELGESGRGENSAAAPEEQGSLILTGALELSENQVTHFYSERKNTQEMLKLLDILLANMPSSHAFTFMGCCFVARLQEILRGSGD